MHQSRFLDHLQFRTAQLAIGPSTLRGQGPAGVVAAARHFLYKLDLSSFSVHDEARFRAILDQRTKELEALFPAFIKGNRQGERSWGGARKALNIFLRDTVYNTDLNSHFGLTVTRAWLEIPLDSHVAEKLAGAAEGQNLGKWCRVKYVTPEINDKYQAVASAVATRVGLPRCDLDVFFWRAAAYDAALKRETQQGKA